MPQQAATNGQIDPVLGLWVPLVVLTVLISWMYHVLAHRPGGQPIGALEWFATAHRRGASAAAHTKIR